MKYLAAAKVIAVSGKKKKKGVKLLVGLPSMDPDFILLDSTAPLAEEGTLLPSQHRPFIWPYCSYWCSFRWPSYIPEQNVCSWAVVWRSLDPEFRVRTWK